MKCTCGYEYEEEDIDYSDGSIVLPQVGDEPFLKCESVYFAFPTFNKFNERTGSNVSSIYACPKCGTVKVDI